MTGRNAHFWHGTAWGGPSEMPGTHGVHVGTQEAARQALNARIGHRADGKDWDGSSEYGKTKLAGKATLRARGTFISGHNVDSPEHDHYPHEHPSPARHSDHPHSSKPTMFPVELAGPMSNTPHTPHADFKANGMMKGQLKKGNAKRGYYYKNEGEDAGSISAVVPGWHHLRRLDQ